MSKTLSTLTALACTAALASAGSANEMTLDSVNSSGGIVASANYELGFSAGLALSGVASSGNYEETVGIWRWFSGATSGVETVPGAEPLVTSLTHAGPNPFGPITTLRFQIASDDGATPTRLEIFDVSGRSVATLIDGSVTPGAYHATWDRRDRSGRLLSSGVYFARFRSGSYTKTVRLVAAK